MEPTEIKAGRLHLRPWQPGDAPAVQAACADPAIQRWTTVPVPYTKKDAREYVEQLSPRGWADGTAALFAVLDATTGRLLGSVGLMDIADGSAEIGYWTAPAARGQGVAAVAVDAACRWAFGSLPVDRIELCHAVENTASARVAEKAGFVLEGRLRRSYRYGDGLKHDELLWSRLAGDPAPLVSTRS